MVYFITHRAYEKPFPLLARVALLAEHAVVAAPVVLKLLPIRLRIGQTVWVERLGTQVATQEVLFVSESAA